MTVHYSDRGDFGMGTLAWLIMGDLRRDVKALKTDGVKEAAGAIADSAERILKKTDRVYTGRLASAFGYVQQPDGADVVNVMPYADAVEYGRPPGPVAFAPILEWTRVKLFGLPRRVAVGSIPWGSAVPLTGLKLTSGTIRRAVRSRQERSARAANRASDPGALEAEAAQAARNIHRKLEEKGTEPTFFMRNSQHNGVRALNRWVRKYLPAVVGTAGEVPF